MNLRAVDTNYSSAIKMIALLFCFSLPESIFGGESGGAAGIEAQKQSAAERISNESRRILKSIKTSEYSHKTKVDEETGKYDVDCSGLVCVILKKVAPQNLKSVPKVHGKSRPLAADFCELFSKAPANRTEAKGWQKIERLSDAKPGDLIAWRRDEIVEGEDTGHIVMVDETPVREEDGQFRVTIIDSTKGPHASDTRKEGVTGVGRGTMWFTVDKDGQPSGYRWRSRTTRATQRPIAIGRIIDLAEKP